MKLVGVLSTAVLSLTLGIAVPAYAQEQHEQQEGQKEKAAKPEEKRAQPQEKKAQQEKNTKQEEKSAQQEKSAKAEEQNAQQRKPETKPERLAQHSGGNDHARIPADRYREHFGREHTFRVSQVDYSRDRRFQYEGYWFGFVDPWPGNWLYTQDVFVVDINGVYYLCNPMYPGVNITLSFNL